MQSGIQYTNTKWTQTRECSRCNAIICKLEPKINGPGPPLVRRSYYLCPQLLFTVDLQLGRPMGRPDIHAKTRHSESWRETTTTKTRLEVGDYAMIRYSYSKWPVVRPWRLASPFEPSMFSAPSGFLLHSGTPSHPTHTPLAHPMAKKLPEANTFLLSHLSKIVGENETEFTCLADVTLGPKQSQNPTYGVWLIWYPTFGTVHTPLVHFPKIRYKVMRSSLL